LGAVAGEFGGGEVSGQERGVGVKGGKGEALEGDGGGMAAETAAMYWALEF